MVVSSSSISIIRRKETSVGKTQNHPLRAFTPSEEQELHRVAHATSERLDAVKRARALLSIQAGRPFTEAARQTGYKAGTASASWWNDLTSGGWPLCLLRLG